MKTGSLTRNIPAGFARRWLPKALLALAFAFAAAFGAPEASAADIATGTVMVSTGNGKVTEFTQTGTMITQIDTTTGAPFTTGSVFDTAGNFYVTDFNMQHVTKFDPTGFLINSNFAGPFNADPESIVLDAAGNFYVGQADGAHTILKFDPTGALLATFAPATEIRGTDWIELGADECTLFYTSEGPDVLTFNACTNTQGHNFNAARWRRFCPSAVARWGDAGSRFIRGSPVGCFRQSNPNLYSARGELSVCAQFRP